VMGDKVPPITQEPLFFPVTTLQFETFPVIPIQTGQWVGDAELPMEPAPQFFPLVLPSSEEAPANPVIPFRAGRVLGDKTQPITIEPKFFPVTTLQFETFPVIPFQVFRDKEPVELPHHGAVNPNFFFFPFIDFTFETHPNIPLIVVPPTAMAPRLDGAIPKFYPTITQVAAIAAASPFIPFRVVPPTADEPRLDGAQSQFRPVLPFNFVTHPNIPIIIGRSDAELDPAIANYPFQRPVFTGFVVGNAPPIAYDATGYGTCILQIDPTLYPSAAAFYMEAVLKSDTGTAAARLFNITDAAAVALSEVTTVSTSFVRLRSAALTLPAGPREYRIEPGFSAAATTTMCGARVIVST